MTGLITNLKWIKKEGIQQYHLQKMKDDLTFKFKDDYREISLEAFTETNQTIGVPRYYEQPFPLLRLDDSSHWDSVCGKFPGFSGKLRPGQDRAIQEVLQKLQSSNPYGGILHAKCGCGKSVFALALMAELKRPTAILVHKSDLMDQWRERIHQFLPSAKVGIVRQDKQDFQDKDIVLCMLQTLSSRKEQLEKIGFFNYFSLNVIDEVHHISATTFHEAMTPFRGKVRIGLSATPKRRDGLEKLFFLTVGPILTTMEGETLTGTYAQIPWVSNISERAYVHKGNVNLSRFISMTASDDRRNDFLLGEFKKALDKRRKCIILSDRLEQVEYFYRKSNGMNSSFYIGGMKRQELEEAKKADLIFSTYHMLEEATDIPDADTLFLVTPRGNIEQCVGRIQRLCAGKKTPVVVDIVDQVGICRGLAQKRLRQYENLGFKPN